MHACRHASMSEGRCKAAFFLGVAMLSVLLVAGCGTSGSIIRQSLNDVVPNVFASSEQDVSPYASEVPYASLDISVNGRSGLIILAVAAGAQTYFLDASRGVIGLRHGYLTQTAGFNTDLLMTEVRSANSLAQTAANQPPPWQYAETGKPVTYTLERQWRTADGVIHTGIAMATLTCQRDPIDVSLPLTTLALQHCDEIANWRSGASTHTVLWRHPQDHRLWRVSTIPWPGGPQIAWRVARPWW